MTVQATRWIQMNSKQQIRAAKFSNEECRTDFLAYRRVSTSIVFLNR